MANSIENLIPAFDDEIILDFDDTLEKNEENIEEPKVDVVVDSSTKKQDVLPDIIIDSESESEAEDKTEDLEDKTEEDNKIPTAIYNQLVEQGIAEQSSDKEEYSWEDVQKSITYYREELPLKVTESIVQQTPEKAKNLVDYIFTKGEKLTFEDLSTFYKEHLEDLSTMNTKVSDDESAKNIIQEHYKAQGYRDSQIRGLIEASEDDGKLVEDAEQILKNRKSISNTKLESAKTEQKEDIQNKRVFAQQVVEELDSTGWNKSITNQIRTQLATEKTWEILNTAINSPKSLVKIANLLRYYDEKSGDIVFDDFIKQIKTKEVKSLKDQINDDMVSTGSKTKSASTKKQTDHKNIESFLSAFRPIM